MAWCAPPERTQTLRPQPMSTRQPTPVARTTGQEPTQTLPIATGRSRSPLDPSFCGWTPRIRTVTHNFSGGCGFFWGGMAAGRKSGGRLGGAGGTQGTCGAVGHVLEASFGALSVPMVSFRGMASSRSVAWVGDSPCVGGGGVRSGVLAESSVGRDALERAEGCEAAGSGGSGAAREGYLLAVVAGSGEDSGGAATSVGAQGD